MSAVPFVALEIRDPPINQSPIINQHTIKVPNRQPMQPTRKERERESTRTWSVSSNDRCESRSNQRFDLALVESCICVLKVESIRVSSPLILIENDRSEQRPDRASRVAVILGKTSDVHVHSINVSRVSLLELARQRRVGCDLREAAQSRKSHGLSSIVVERHSFFSTSLYRHGDQIVAWRIASWSSEQEVSDI